MVEHEITVTVSDAHSRRVLEHALWYVISASVIGERELSEACFNEAWRSVHPNYALDDQPAEAEFRLTRLAIIRRALRTLAAAAQGTELRLPVSPTEFEAALLELLAGIEQNDELLDWLSEEDVGEVAACQAAARGMLGDVPEPLGGRGIPERTRVPDLAGPLHAARLVHPAQV